MTLTLNIAIYQSLCCDIQKTLIARMSSQIRTIVFVAVPLPQSSSVEKMPEGFQKVVNADYERSCPSCLLSWLGTGG